MAVYRTRRRKIGDQKNDPRIRVASILILIVTGIVVCRLFVLMVLQHGFYTALAAGTHAVYASLFPARGSVFLQDSRTGEEYPLAINREYFVLFADTRDIENDEIAEDVAEKLAEVLEYDDENKFEVFKRLQKVNDPYEPIEEKVSEDVKEKIEELNLPGIKFISKDHRYYPEEELASHVIGFLGRDEEGKNVGYYGIEGYWQKELAGSGGFFEGAKSAAGFWIPLAGRSLKPSEDGVDVLLTLDRTLQYQTCEILKQAYEEYEAVSASLIIMDPYTGAIRTMCGFPDFNPNEYNQVESIDVYNNNAIFMPYEPGSIFKPMVMGAALNEELVTPESSYFDSGEIEVDCLKPIRNADGKDYEWQTMTGVLAKSINTGMVYVAQELGKKRLKKYIEDFGFGVKTGVNMDSERGGTIDTLDIVKKDKLDCYGATASFGQGITATPLQMVLAYSAIANGGDLMSPFIVEQVRYEDGRVERAKPKKIRQVLDKRAASLLSGMLVSVVDSGQGAGAAVSGYYVAGKTGTAQIAGPGGYTDETNHSFVGFAPVDEPQFVAIVKFEKPKRGYSSVTAAPTFAKIAEFALQYYQVPPGR